jgi:BON domain
MPRWHKTCLTATEGDLLRREDMMRRTWDLSMSICLILAALVVGCTGDRMSRSTEEAVDDNLLTNKVKIALYADKQVSGRQIAVEASQGVIQLSGVVASLPEAQRAIQIAQGIKGVKEVRNHLTVQ